MGMGKYQWCVFTLCGFGYFLDLCWAQAGGLVGSAIIEELGVSGMSLRSLRLPIPDLHRAALANACLSARRPRWRSFHGVQRRLDSWSVLLGINGRHRREEMVFQLDLLVRVRLRIPLCW